LPGLECETYGRIASKIWINKEITGKSRKSHQNLIFTAYFLNSPAVGGTVLVQVRQAASSWLDDQHLRHPGFRSRVYFQKRRNSIDTGVTSTMLEILLQIPFKLNHYRPKYRSATRRWSDIPCGGVPGKRRVIQGPARNEPSKGSMQRGHGQSGVAAAVPVVTVTGALSVVGIQDLLQ